MRVKRISGTQNKSVLKVCAPLNELEYHQGFPLYKTLINHYIVCRAVATPMTK